MLMIPLCRCCEFRQIIRPINNMDCCGAPSSRIESTASLPQLADDVDFSGPVKTRECKDVFILMVFSVFAVYMVCVAIAAASRRDYARLTHRMDSHGNLCGLDNRHKKLFGVPLSGQDMRGKFFYLFILLVLRLRLEGWCNMVQRCSVGILPQLWSSRGEGHTAPPPPSPLPHSLQSASRLLKRHLYFLFGTMCSIECGETPSRLCASKHAYSIEYTAVTIEALPQKRWHVERREASRGGRGECSVTELFWLLVEGVNAVRFSLVFCATAIAWGEQTNASFINCKRQGFIVSRIWHTVLVYPSTMSYCF
ncbi:unnamed protein product [Ixodes persulcatus]